MAAQREPHLSGERKMALDDLDLKKRQKTAAQNVATALTNNPRLVDPYSLAAYQAGLKPAAGGYPAAVAAVIAGYAGIVRTWNQRTNVQENRPFANLPAWLAAGNTAFWVHCYGANPPANARYRCYVCADLGQAHTLLSAILNGFHSALYFKVADHDEATMRNDTFVSWHDTLDEAKAWAAIAKANPGMLRGNAPAGTFGGAGTTAVGIDEEQAGQTSTNKIAQAGVTKAVSKNPYI
jgi:hypothetical protein